MGKKEPGFTMIEILVVVVIIGILAAVSIAAYSRYITSARAAEAPRMLGAIILYCMSYHRSQEAWPPESCHTHNGNTDEWIDEVVGNKNVYFEYHYDQDKLRVRAHSKDEASAIVESEDELIYNLATQQWSATGRLVDVIPD